MKKILVADGDVDLRTLFKFILTREGYPVEQAENEQELLQKASACQPNLIIVGMWLPGIDGYDCIKQLKSDLATQHILIILYILNDIQLKEAELLPSIDGFICRPFVRQDVVALVKELIGNHEEI